jgi:heptosyltransferase-3
VKILVLHPGALGDIILSLPALGLLRDHFPSARITLAANLDFSAPVCNGYADKLVSLSTLPLHRLYSGELLTDTDLFFWKSYDRILSWTGSGDQQFSRNLSAANADNRIARWKPAPEDNRHVSQIFVDSLRPWVPLQAAAPLPEIRLTEADLLGGQEWLGEERWTGSEALVALHPGAGSPVKYWSSDRFRELACEIMRSVTRNLLIVGGPAEQGLAHLIGPKAPGVSLRFAEDLPLGLLAGALARCQAFVGNDSGISHLAAGLGVPSVVLFGPTSPAHWAPRGKHVRILYDTRGCSACESRTLSDHICLDNISTQDCVTALRDCL